MAPRACCYTPTVIRRPLAACQAAQLALWRGWGVAPRSAGALAGDRPALGFLDDELFSMSWHTA